MRYHRRHGCRAPPAAPRAFAERPDVRAVRGVRSPANVAKLPAFELDLPRRSRAAPHRTAERRRAARAGDRSASFTPTSAPSGPRAPAPGARSASRSPGPPTSRRAGGSRRRGRWSRRVATSHADARLLAEYGEAPRHWLMTAPLRVARDRAPARAPAGARGAAERGGAARAGGRGRARRVRRARAHGGRERTPTTPTRSRSCARAEDVLRSRDRVLAAEQDAQKARLASVDARIARARGETRAGARRRASGRGASSRRRRPTLAREEAKLKRAESELRAAQQRESGRGGG